MISSHRLQDELIERRHAEEVHLSFLTPFPDPLPFDFNVFRATAYKRFVEKPYLPKWFEKASEGWPLVTLRDTHTYRLIYTLFQILCIRGGRKGKSSCGHNDVMRDFSNWFHDLLRDSNAFYSLVFLHLASENFLPNCDNGTVDDARLIGLERLFFHLTDELHHENEDAELYYEYIKTGWLKCSEQLKQELHTVLDYILSVQSRRELFDIHLAMGYSKSSTEELLAGLMTEFQVNS